MEEEINMKRQMRADKFRAKNTDRKNSRNNGTVRDQREARRLRRLVDGKFGDANNSNWNDMVYGTTGAARTSR